MLWEPSRSEGSHNITCLAMVIHKNTKDALRNASLKSAIDIEINWYCAKSIGALQSPPEQEANPAKDENGREGDR